MFSKPVQLCSEEILYVNFFNIQKGVKILVISILYTKHMKISIVIT